MKMYTQERPTHARASDQRRANDFKIIWRWLIYCIGISYVALLPHFYYFTNAETRFSKKWNWEHLGAIAAAAVILGSIYWLAASGTELMVTRLFKQRIRQGLHLIYGSIVVSLIIRTVVAILDRVMGESVLSRGGVLGGGVTKVLLYGLAPLFLLVATRKHFFKVIQYLCVISFILFLIFIGNAVLYPRYDVDPTPAPLPPISQQHPKGPPNIFILVFDECSYDHIYHNGILRPDLPHLASLAETATVYHQHYSAGTTTITSLPRLLFQVNTNVTQLNYTQLTELIYKNRAFWEPNIFTGYSNYFRAVFGSYHNYALLLGEDVDYTTSLGFIDNVASFSQRIGYYILTQAAWLRFFGVNVERHLTEMQFDGETECLEQQLSIALELADRTAVEPVYAFCHFLIPHPPFVWDAHGLVEKGLSRTEQESYFGNIRYMDTILGYFMQHLHQAGTFENTLLIVTSDHAWRNDPALGNIDHKIEDQISRSVLRHVPLLVKLPFQQDPAQEDTFISSLQISTIIEQAVARKACYLGH